MRPRDNLRFVVAIVVAAFLASAPVAVAQTEQPKSDAGQWKRVEEAMGRPGKLQPDGTFKFSMPRSDLHVTVRGTPIQAGLALGSWTAFVGTPDHAMVMGDLVLTEDEVEPVMMKLQQEGIQQTALHNHLLHETPRVMYMHVEGHGNAMEMAKVVNDALALTKTPTVPSRQTVPVEQKLDLDINQINSVLGHTGKVNGGILQVSVPRSEKIMDEGMEVPSSMGTATSLNFQPTGKGRAAIAGDIVLLPREVNPVLKALRESGIEVTALHSHMINDQPHLLFMHFWANDDATKLARGLRAALDETNSAGREKTSK